MQKMAKFQINEVGVFGGFFIPYADKKTRQKIRFLKQKYKNKVPDSVARKQKIKISLAILGGGDVVFPLILAGVVFRSLGLLPALAIILFSTIALFFSRYTRKTLPSAPLWSPAITLTMSPDFIFSFIILLTN